MSEDIGLTCLYKDGEAKNFIGEEVQEAMEEGWKDSPYAKVEKDTAPEKPTATKAGQAPPGKIENPITPEGPIVTDIHPSTSRTITQETE
jgi:hypothetical protein